jgi:hypothetical protein
MDLDELDDVFAASNARARRGRRLARLTFVATAGLTAFFVTLGVVLADPCSQMMCPMFETPPGPNVAQVTMGLGIAGLAAGLVWMWRILRAGRDLAARSSRFHRY